MDTTTDSKALEGLGSYLRPLLSEAGVAMGLETAGFIGIAFSHPTDVTLRVVFAEFVNQSNRADSYDADYTLPTACEFARAIASAANETSHLAPYRTNPDEPSSVRDPLAKEFPDATDPQAIFAHRAGDDDSAILYFIAESMDRFVSFPGRFGTARNLLIKTLRDALFLAATAEPQLGPWSDRLISKLPEVFPKYTEAQKRALAKVRHPYLQWQEGGDEVPVVQGATLSADERRFVSAIRGAALIKVNGPLAGSFQDHQVYSATVTPSSDAKPFEAAIKVAAQSQADKELRGYFSLLPYFREIRDVMPAAPLVFPTGQKTPGKKGAETEEDEYTVVTPHLGGQSLFSFIEHEWVPNDDRVATLRAVFMKLREFVSSIRPPTGASTERPAYVRLYESHLSEKQRNAGGRFKKTVERFAGSMAPAFQNAPLFTACGQTLINPLWVLNNAPLEPEAPKPATFWTDARHADRPVRYGHGDFHVGNILFDAANDRVTVLDFDYVGVHPEHDDAATLEASFVLAVAASHPLHDAGKWVSFWPDAIRYLAGKLPLARIENNRLAYDLATLVAVIRGHGRDLPLNAYMPTEYGYHVCLVAALLRLFTSHAQKMDEAQFQPVGATAIFWLGLLLERLVTAPPGEAVALDLFTDVRRPPLKRRANDPHA